MQLPDSLYCEAEHRLLSYDQTLVGAYTRLHLLRDV
jgi:hypothetical protein